MRSLAEALQDVPDYRSRRGQRHEVSALLVLVCIGMLCGCGSLQALTAWGTRQEGALLRAMGFERGIENRVHFVRDATMGEDVCRLPSGNGPRALATVRNALLTTLRLPGVLNVAEALHVFPQSPYRALAQFVFC